MVKVIINKQVAFTGSIRSCFGRIKDLLWSLTKQARDRYNENLEFLPPGEWKVVHNGSGASNWGSMYDPTNLQFLAGLSPEIYIISRQVFGRSRSYQGFVVRARSGKPIALLDTDKTQNAMYAFDASDPEWLAVALLKKNEVRQGTRNGAYPQCIAWMNHGVNFQERVRGLLERL